MRLHVGVGDPSTEDGLVSDMMQDPNLGLPLFSIKNEQGPVEPPGPPPLTLCMYNGIDCNALESPALFTQTPCLYDLSLEYGNIYGNEILRAAALETGYATHPPTPPSSIRDEPAAKKRKATYEPDASETPATDSSQAPEQDAERSRFLERNRKAASKCREKKRQWVLDLEATRDDLKGRHVVLQREYRGLLEEATQIKTSLMVHAVCDDRNIDMWIKSEAVRFVRRSSRRNHAADAAVESRHSSTAFGSSLASPTDAPDEPPAPRRGPCSLAGPAQDAQLSPPDLNNFDYKPDDMFGEVG